MFFQNLYFAFVSNSLKKYDFLCLCFVSIKHIHNIKYKMYLQNEKMAELWVFVDFSKKRRLEIIYETSLQNETVRWITRRSCCWKVFRKKVVPKSFTKFTWKHLCWSLFFSKVVGLRSETLLKRLQYRCFQKNFMKFFKNTF